MGKIQRPLSSIVYLTKKKSLCLGAWPSCQTCILCLCLWALSLWAFLWALSLWALFVSLTQLGYACISGPPCSNAMQYTHIERKDIEKLYTNSINEGLVSCLCGTFMLYHNVTHWHTKPQTVGQHRQRKNQHIYCCFLFTSFLCENTTEVRAHLHNVTLCNFMSVMPGYPQD